jgi:hypothetical protein
MKLFSYQNQGATLVCWAFNRGHAAKLIAKFVEARGHVYSKEIPLPEIVPPDDEKGAVVVIQSPPEWCGA